MFAQQLSYVIFNHLWYIIFSILGSRGDPSVREPAEAGGSITQALGRRGIQQLPRGHGER